MFVRKIFKTLLSEKTRLQLWYSYFKLRGLFYRGHTVHCVCCVQGFRTFLPYGSPLRLQAVCPACHSLERNRLLWLFLKKESTIFTKPVSLLHIAPEPALQNKFKKISTLQYRSADLYSPLAIDKQDLMNLTYPTESYDYVICSHVLAHLPDDKKALQEIYRVLKPGGAAILQEHIFEQFKNTHEQKLSTTAEQRLQNYGQDDRFRNYGADLPIRIADAGFSVKVIAYSTNFTENEQAYYGLHNTGAIFLAVK